MKIIDECLVGAAVELLLAQMASDGPQILHYPAGNQHALEEIKNAVENSSFKNNVMLVPVFDQPEMPELYKTLDAAAKYLGQAFNDNSEPPAPSQVAAILASGNADRAAPVSDCIVYTSGCFDLLHCGHVEFLRRARELGTKLIVGLNSDASVRSLKGPKRPVMNVGERKRMLLATRYVDEVSIFDEQTPCDDVERIRPNIIVKGPDYEGMTLPESTVAEKWGAKTVILQSRFEISTTKIIERIKAL